METQVLEQEAKTINNTLTVSTSLSKDATIETIERKEKAEAEKIRLAELAGEFTLESYTERMKKVYFIGADIFNVEHKKLDAKQKGKKANAQQMGILGAFNSAKKDNGTLFEAYWNKTGKAAPIEGKKNDIFNGKIILGLLSNKELFNLVKNGVQIKASTVLQKVEKLPKNADEFLSLYRQGETIFNALMAYRKGQINLYELHDKLGLFSNSDSEGQIKGLIQYIERVEKAQAKAAEKAATNAEILKLEAKIKALKAGK